MRKGHVERLIGSIRRECLDHVVVLGERHLRHLLANYATYYNRVRTHLALDKDAPLHRPAQTVGLIASVTWVGGLHRHYVPDGIIGRHRYALTGAPEGETPGGKPKAGASRR